MTVSRGEVWLVNLDPTKGSEQAGLRPVIVIQSDIINKYTRTYLTVPVTTNLKRADLPSCLLIRKGDGKLNSDSVALCHQARVLDKVRLTKKIGKLSDETMIALDGTILFTLGITG